MAVTLGGRSVSRPSGVCDGDLGNESLGSVNSRFCDLLAQTDNLAFFFEEKDFSGLITVATQTSGVVATVFFTGKTAAQDFKDFFTTLTRPPSINTRCNPLYSVQLTFSFKKLQ